MIRVVDRVRFILSKICIFEPPKSPFELAVFPSMYAPGSVVVFVNVDGFPEGMEAEPLQNPDDAVKRTVPLS